MSEMCVQDSVYIVNLWKHRSHRRISKTFENRQALSILDERTVLDVLKTYTFIISQSVTGMSTVHKEEEKLFLMNQLLTELSSDWYSWWSGCLLMKILLIGERGDHFGSKHLLINTTSKGRIFLFRSFYDRTKFEVKALSLIRVEKFQT
jgi:hypothetical protein